MTKKSERADGSPFLAPVDPSDVPTALARVFQAKGRSDDGLGNLVRVVARSRPTWQIVARSEQLFATFEAIDPKTKAMVCTFVSMLNRSEYCIDDCAASALEAGVDRLELLALGHPATWRLDPTTVMFLCYSAHVIVDPCSIPTLVTDELSRVASAEQILELTTMASLKAFWNHLVSALQIPMEGRCADPQLLGALLDASTSADRLAREAGVRAVGD